MFLSQKGGGVWVAYAGGKRCQIGSIKFKEMMSLLSDAPHLLHSSFIFP